jgi:hypothetical protein
MKSFTSGLIALAFSASAAFAAPSFNAIRQGNNCQFASAIQVTAYGAAGASNTVDVTYDNVWHDITNGEYPFLPLDF